MEKTLKELADAIGGEVRGNPGLSITGVAPIEEAGAGQITFVANEKYAKLVTTTKASAIIVSEDFKFLERDLIISDNPYLGFAKILTIFSAIPAAPTGIHPKADVAASASIGRDASIHAFVSIGERARIGSGVTILPGTWVGEDCTIGDGTFISGNVSICRGSVIGSRVRIHSGTVIGSDGFGYARDNEKYFKIPQTGIVEIGDDVEIGANVCIDRATMGRTVIGRGTKIDNLVHVAHNVKIGENTILIAQVGISGSTKIGSNVILAGQVGVTGHIEIGDLVMVGAQSGIAHDVKPGSAISGSPAIPHREWLRMVATLPKVPEMRRQINDLNRKIAELEEKLKKGDTTPPKEKK